MGSFGDQKILVVGAGPVGALAGLYAATRGYQVEIYELRGDLRDPQTVPLNFTKSINLALSERGINSMKLASCPGLLEAVLGETIPMYGRMIHGRKNRILFEQSQAYDVHGRAILAVDRAVLNKCLLDRLENMPNVKLFFNHRLTGADFKKNLAWFEKRDPPRTDHAQNPTQSEHSKRAPEIEVAFDFMIGADGAHSAARYHLMKFARVSYQQEYIDTLWCEFHIPPSSSGTFRISPNHLHIWPGKDFMFIAIPSKDNTFTSTLFLTASAFAHLDAHPDSIVPFFQKHFPGVVPDLIEEKELRNQYLTNPHLPLISVKCRPYHFKSSVVIVGDAAHAMVPFYGQGMNTGFEDIRVLFEILDRYTSNSTDNEQLKSARALALDEYTAYRLPDTTIINDLALRNYQEMRSDVQSPIYRLRKWVEETLSLHFPSLGWATQYSRISFGNDRYSEVEKAAQRQFRILKSFLGVGLMSIIGGMGWMLWRLRRQAPRSTGIGLALFTKYIRSTK